MVRVSQQHATCDLQHDMTRCSKLGTGKKLTTKASAKTMRLLLEDGDNLSKKIS